MTVGDRQRRDPPKEAMGLIASHTVMSLATVFRGTPHVVSLMYANQGYTLYWVSDPRSRHSLALEENPAAAVTIAGQFDDFPPITGVQLRGSGFEVGDTDEAGDGLRLLSERYEFLRRFFVSGPLDLARRFELASVYRFEPDEVTLIDNRVRFAHKDVFRPGELA